MQNTDAQAHFKTTAFYPGRVGESSAPAGCVNKKWLFFVLRPYLRKYRPDVLRVFFTSERLQRCNIHPDDYASIRTFSPEATHVILSDLKKFGFLDEK